MSHYLEDFQPGQIFTSASRTLTLEQIQTFAREFDPQPFHLDPAAAEKSFFGKLVASGWHTAAATMRLLVESDLNIAGGLIGLGVQEISWPRPVLPGDALTAQTEILEVVPSRSKPDRGTLKTKTTTRNQKGETVMSMSAILLVLRSNSSPPSR